MHTKILLFNTISILWIEVVQSAEMKTPRDLQELDNLPYPLPPTFDTPTSIPDSRSWHHPPTPCLPNQELANWPARTKSPDPRLRDRSRVRDDSPSGSWSQSWGPIWSGSDSQSWSGWGGWGDSRSRSRGNSRHPLRTRRDWAGWECPGTTGTRPGVNGLGRGGNGLGWENLREYLSKDPKWS